MISKMCNLVVTAGREEQTFKRFANLHNLRGSW